jgi:hypothetical protein
MTPNVVIIGNGTNCLSNQFGELIDSYDIIVRFNDYNIDGYESYIGTKTTYFVTHNNFLPVDPLLPKKFEHSIIWKMPNEEIKFAIESSEYINYSNYEFFNDYPMSSKIFCPSTAMWTVSLFIIRYKHVVLYNCDGLKSGHYWNPSHTHWHQHNGDVELEYYSYLQENGQLTLWK